MLELHYREERLIIMEKLNIFFGCWLDKLIVGNNSKLRSFMLTAYPFLLSIGLGVLHILAFAPNFYWWCSIISLSGFFILLRSVNSPLKALVLSFVYFLGYFLPFVAWIDRPLLRLFIIFTALWMTLIHTFWIGYLGWLARRLPIFLHLLLFSLLWGSGEWLRGHLLTGIPWNLLSYIWLFNEVWVQTANWWGSYGLVIPTVFIFTTPALIILQPKALSTWLVVLVSIVFTIGGYLYGNQRLNHNPTTYWPDITLRLVQTNFHFTEKFPLGYKLSIFKNKRFEKSFNDELLDKYIEQTFGDNPKGIRAFIWPEAAINHYYFNYVSPKFKEMNLFVEQIQKSLPTGSVLITGLQRSNLQDGWILKKALWNGIAVFNQEGLAAWYSKHHLVPFAEYMPVLQIFDVPNLLSVVLGTSKMDYTPGPGPAVLDIPELPPFAVSICFEGIFPNEIVLRNNTSIPAWMLVVSNDDWYHKTRYPEWLLQMIRMRTVEQGLPLVRVANSGISAVFDGLGRVQVVLPAYTFQNADVKLPRPLPNTTLYAGYGDYVLGMMLMIGILFLLFSFGFQKRITQN